MQAASVSVSVFRVRRAGRVRIQPRWRTEEDRDKVVCRAKRIRARRRDMSGGGSGGGRADGWGCATALHCGPAAGISASVLFRCALHASFNRANAAAGPWSRPFSVRWLAARLRRRRHWPVADVGLSELLDARRGGPGRGFGRLRSCSRFFLVFSSPPARPGERKQ